MTDCACNGLEQVFVVATTKKESVRLRLWPAETLAMEYVEVRIARIFNTYGPKMCIDDWSCCQKLCWRRLVNNIVHEWAL
ncbi:hypothetical protein F2Q69_00049680 [Brassica cretica]|uniref:Uncharacterized protein n=1 Tax=Brassica cretica TaxID=69181 RepID=A0A8S9Q7S3_BRACR|nr:hypothetical protein F2Q69_00049680 [Brassica cretica]